MKKLTIIILIALCTLQLYSQGAHFHRYTTNRGSCSGVKNLHMKEYGKPYDEPILFLHGGPGYNCANFQATTAQKLADQGFYVITYDRRGEGRSTIPAKYTFKETFKDIISLMKCSGVKKVHIIGHSFGGMVGTLFAKQYPDKVKSLILVGAPVNLQENFQTIIRSCKAIYTKNDDATNLMYIDKLEKMDTTTMDYASYCFMHAIKNGFYSPRNMSEEAKKIYADFKSSELYKEAIKMTAEPPTGFSNNEKYTMLDLSGDLKELIAKGTQVYGLYGKEDGLYSAKQVSDLGEIIGTSHLKYFDNCSHNVFMDQQEAFLKMLVEWCK
jgi:proline iminopeptidase